MTKQPPIEQLYYPYRARSTVRVALSRLALSLDAGFDRLHYEPRIDVCRMKPDVVDLVREQYRATLSEAYKLQADVVCFGELMFPYGAAGGPEFVVELHELATRYGVTIVAGSYHDTDYEPDKRYYNTAPLLAPCADDPLYQLKQNPATKVGEHLDIPQDKELVIVGTPACNLACLICLDMREAPFTEAIQKANINVGKVRAELILCPAYDPSHDIRLDCVETAIGAQAWVGFVNACVGDRGIQTPALFRPTTGEEVPPTEVTESAYYYDLDNFRLDVLFTPVLR